MCKKYIAKSRHVRSRGGEITSARGGAAAGYQDSQAALCVRSPQTVAVISKRRQIIWALAQSHGPPRTSTDDDSFIKSDNDDDEEAEED